jgi:hypothetical protein
VCGFERKVEAHVYKNVCDADCENCGFTREVDGHKYSNECDATCNNCGEERTVSGHQYDHDCDAECNVCGDKRDVGEHDFGEYHIEVEPTEEEEGLRVRECQICGATESEVIEALGADSGGNIAVIVVAAVIGVLVLALMIFMIIKRYTS